MYAIIQTGGKQYRVQSGETIRVERIEANPGEQVTFKEILLLGGDGALRVGAPYVEGASVQGTVVAQGRLSKIRVFKYKKRKHYRRTKGHRQYNTTLRIDTIQA
ncbi:MAG: 50S ribosomal protein L21 [Vicinamibacteria bacterium]|nr:50S ribosomal protein L21 [Vicinamibacteria bacterium]